MHSKVRNTLTPVWDEEFDFAVSPHAMTEELGISFVPFGGRVRSLRIKSSILCKERAPL